MSYGVPGRNGLSAPSLTPRAPRTEPPPREPDPVPPQLLSVPCAEVLAWLQGLHAAGQGLPFASAMYRMFGRSWIARLRLLHDKGLIKLWLGEGRYGRDVIILLPDSPRHLRSPDAPAGVDLT